MGGQARSPWPSGYERGIFRRILPTYARLPLVHAIIKLNSRRSPVLQKGDRAATETGTAAWFQTDPERRKANGGLTMKFVLLSGGSGKRLWPMSNDSRSKQFLRVLTDGDGRSQSMVQRVWGQMQRAGLADDAFICTSKAQVEMIESQIGDVPMIVEPARRDTFPAIALATLYLTDVQGAADDETVVVLPVDPYVDDGFFAALRDLECVLRESGAELALLGVTPAEPSSKFGYIKVRSDASDEVAATSVAPAQQTGAEAVQTGLAVLARQQTGADDVEPDRGGYLHAAGFVEKPPRATAERLLAEGALWNCGVFCFRAGYIKEILRRKAYPYSYGELSMRYDELVRRSFDYEVVEQAASITVTVYRGMWKDLGTWETLANEMSAEVAGLGVAANCSGSHIINELGIPLVAIGLHNVMVVATPDGILAADKEQSGHLKQVLGKLQYPGRPMYEERRWGHYRVLDYTKLEDGTEVLTKTVVLSEDRNISYHKHLMRTEVWTVIEGTGELFLGTRRVEIAPGDVVRVPPDQWHAIRALTQLTFIEVQRGASLMEEDVVRRFANWRDIEAHCAALAT